MLNVKKELIPEKAGIYCITNLINNKVYIGSSTNLYRRLLAHKSLLKSNKHDNIYLQRAFNLHKEENFIISILEYCKKDIQLLLEKEQYYYNLYSNTYNLRKITISNLGIKKRPMSEETLKKFSEVKKGKIPQNLSIIQQLRTRKIAKYVDNIIVEIFDSCTKAAESLNLTPNSFNQYIGKKLGRKKSKYFNKNVHYEYYKEDLCL